MTSSVVDYAAWWGAGLSTSIFLWQIITWYLDRPKLRLVAVPDVYFPDRFKNDDVESAPDGARKLAPFIGAEITNVGSRATTLLEVRLTKRIKGGSAHSPPHLFANDERLPRVLPSGHCWLCWFNASGGIAGSYHSEDAPMHIEARSSHSSKWYVVKVPKNLK